MREINSFLDNELVRRTRQWQQLKRMLGQALPSEFMQKISYASFENGKLTIFSDAPEWSSRIRFYTAEITEVFEREDLTVSDIQAKAAPRPQARPLVDD